MTEIEAVGMATAIALKAQGDTPESWAKAQADRASEWLAVQFKAGNISIEDFTRANARVSGNHSQRRQFLAASGLLATKESDSAEKRAIQSALTALDKAEDENLANATKAPAKK